MKHAKFKVGDKVFVSRGPLENDRYSSEYWQRALHLASLHNLEGVVVDFDADGHPLVEFKDKAIVDLDFNRKYGRLVVPARYLDHLHHMDAWEATNDILESVMDKLKPGGG